MILQFTRPLDRARRPGCPVQPFTFETSVIWEDYEKPFRLVATWEPETFTLDLVEEFEGFECHNSISCVLCLFNCFFFCIFAMRIFWFSSQVLAGLSSTCSNVLYAEQNTWKLILAGLKRQLFWHTSHGLRQQTHLMWRLAIKSSP